MEYDYNKAQAVLRSMGASVCPKCFSKVETFVEMRTFHDVCRRCLEMRGACEELRIVEL